MWSAARTVWGGCEACHRRAGCTAFNWRAEPLASNCMLLGSQRGQPTGNALSSAGLVQAPAVDAGVGAIVAGQRAAGAPPEAAGSRRPPRKLQKQRTKKRGKKRAKD